MVVTLQLHQIDVQPGQYLTLREINWAEFEAILDEIGEHRATRLAYFHGVLEIWIPYIWEFTCNWGNFAVFKIK